MSRLGSVPPLLVTALALATAGGASVQIPGTPDTSLGAAGRLCVDLQANGALRSTDDTGVLIPTDDTIERGGGASADGNGARRGVAGRSTQTGALCVRPFPKPRPPPEKKGEAMSLPQLHRDRTSLGRSLLLGTALLLATSAQASGPAVFLVPPPNGVDDTAAIHAALDAAVAHGPGATVQLAAGIYRTQQLVVYNFRGTFQGVGMGQTTVEALPNLLVNIPDICVYGERLPNTTTNRWPSVMIFVDGDFRLADFTLSVPAAPGTATITWYMCDEAFTSLLDGIRIMGQYPTHATVEGVAVEGRPDDSPTSFIGYNVINGVDFLGELPRSEVDLDYFTLSGSFTVRRSAVKSVGFGLAVGAFVENARVTLGGAPSDGNILEDTAVAFDLESAQDSHFEVSYNRAEASWYPLWVVPWCCWVPERPSHYAVHHNLLVPTADFAEGIFLLDEATRPWIRANLHDNRIEPRDVPLWEGIGAYHTVGTVIRNNAILGEGADAIGLWGASQCKVIGNDLGGFVADPALGLAQIFLDPDTTRNQVVCQNQPDTVLDEGTKNRIVGCRP